MTVRDIFLSALSASDIDALQERIQKLIGEVGAKNVPWPPTVWSDAPKSHNALVYYHIQASPGSGPLPLRAASDEPNIMNEGF